jgi:hypothetical protein
LGILIGNLFNKEFWIGNDRTNTTPNLWDED